MNNLENLCFSGSSEKNIKAFTTKKFVDVTVVYHPTQIYLSSIPPIKFRLLVRILLPIYICWVIIQVSRTKDLHYHLQRSNEYSEFEKWDLIDICIG